MIQPFNFFRYIKIFYRYAGFDIFILFILGFVSGAIELLGIGMLLPVLNMGIPGGSDNQLTEIFSRIFAFFHYQPTLSGLLFLLVVIFSLKAVAVFATKFWSSIVALKLKKTLQRELVEKLLNTSYSHYTTLNTGWLSNILVKEAAIFSQGFLEFVRIQTVLLYIAAYFVGASILRFDLTLVLLGLSVLLALPMRYLMRIIRSASRNLTGYSGVLNSGFVEFLDNFTYAKATGAAQNFQTALAGRIDDTIRAERKLLFFAALIGSVTEPVAVFSLAVLIFTQVVMGGSQLSEIIVLGLFIYRIVSKVMLLQGQWQRFNTTFGSIDIIQNIMHDFENYREPDGEVTVSHIDQPIYFKNVSLSHGTHKVIDDVSIEIPPGKTIGLVGASGAGKTTLFYMLTALLPPDAGQIFLGDTDYAQIKKNSLREKIGYISQNPAMIGGTLLENINFGYFDPDHPGLEARVLEAMEMAGLEDMKDSLDKQTGEKGLQISGGQKQRIAIAREMLRNTDLLIMDEATSALDSFSEKKIQQTLHHLHGQKTIVIISHRLTNIKDCDLIYLLDKGKLLASGTFDELLGRDSQFRHLYELQNIAAHG